jgi:hypothetical protein
VAFRSGYYHWHPDDGTLFWDCLPMTVFWKWTGDLRPYVLVQFYPMMALPLLLLLFPPRYTGGAALWGMMALYVVAKALELADAQIETVIATGGHPWKHVAAAGAMACYAGTVRVRAGQEPRPT